MKKTQFLLILVSLLVLTGCSSYNQSNERLGDKNSRFESLEELKEAFVEAGGQCWGWKLATHPDELENLIGKGDCDSKTVLIVYDDYIDVEQEAINSRRHNESLGFKTSYLFGGNWFINSDQVEVVYPKMGGTLMTR
jgi:hypothetical protein